MSDHAAASIGAAVPGLRRRTPASLGGIRVIVALSVALIAGSFAAAGALQLRIERGRALAQAEQFESRRAGEIAADMAGAFNRYADLGGAFAHASGAESAAALSEAGGPALRNIAVLTARGTVVSQMKGAPVGLLPLPAAALMEVTDKGRSLVATGEDGGMALLIADGARIIAVELDLKALLSQASMEQAVLANASGRILELGARWHTPPAVETLDLGGRNQAVRYSGSDGQRRLVALAAVPGWPAVAGASVKVGEALSSWYASLPLFVFFIVGPALAGAGLAVVFVREFERRARAADAVKSLKATPPGDAKLLIRLADAERRAAEAERSKAEFVAHMSHELRTPLNAIIGFSEVIQQNTFGKAGHPKYGEYAGDIAAAGKALHAKIGAVLEYANLEAGRHPLTLGPLDVAAIAREAVDELAGRAFSRRIRLQVNVPACPKARGDAASVRRILTNLLTNALEYTPEGGTVRVTAKAADGAVAVAIADSGQGFTREEQRLAGGAFVRFDRPGAVTGIGMGLAVSLALSRQMGAVLRLAGAPGQGTIAELRLPRA